MTWRTPLQTSMSVYGSVMFSPGVAKPAGLTGLKTPSVIERTSWVPLCVGGVRGRQPRPRPSPWRPTARRAGACVPRREEGARDELAREAREGLVVDRRAAHKVVEEHVVHGLEVVDVGDVEDVVEREVVRRHGVHPRGVGRHEEGVLGGAVGLDVVIGEVREVLVEDRRGDLDAGDVARVEEDGGVAEEVLLRIGDVRNEEVVDHVDDALAALDVRLDDAHREGDVLDGACDVRAEDEQLRGDVVRVEVPGQRGVEGVQHGAVGDVRREGVEAADHVVPKNRIKVLRAARGVDARAERVEGVLPRLVVRREEGERDARVGRARVEVVRRLGRRHAHELERGAEVLRPRRQELRDGAVGLPGHAARGRRPGEGGERQQRDRSPLHHFLLRSPRAAVSPSLPPSLPLSLSHARAHTLPSPAPPPPSRRSLTHSPSPSQSLRPPGFLCQSRRQSRGRPPPPRRFAFVFQSKKNHL